MANQIYPSIYQFPPGDPCPTCGQAMSVSWKSVFNGREFVPVPPPPQWEHSCSWCADPRTKALLAEVALAREAKVRAAERNRRLRDFAESLRTHRDDAVPATPETIGADYFRGMFDDEDG